MIIFQSAENYNVIFYSELMREISFYKTYEFFYLRKYQNDASFVENISRLKT